MKHNQRYIIGIDCGVETGFAVWDKELRQLVKVETMKIHAVMVRVLTYYLSGHNFLVRVEDPRKRNWFGESGREKLQGAGSVKRDAKIWEDFLKDHGIDHEMVAPKNNKTKLTPETFARITGWKGRTSVHARDAAMLVFGL